MKTMLLATLALVLPLSAPAKADPAYDMATFTCQDWLDASDDERDLMLVWLRGYLGGHAGTSLYAPDGARMDRSRMETYCRGHLAIGVISAMSQLGPH